MNFKKIIAITLLAGTCLLAVSCGTDAETESGAEQGTDTDAVDTAADSTADTATDAADTEAATTDIVIGDPTDEFVMPEGAEGIVGTWKLGGAEGAAAKNTELWVFGADGSYSMIYVDDEGKVVGSEITGAYRIKGDELAVTMNSFTLTYPSYSFEEGNLVIGDRDVVSGEITYMTLEPYTGSITRG